MSPAPETHEFTHSGPVEASVRLGSGDLFVVAEPTDTVSVRVSPHDNSDSSRAAAANTTVDFTGGRLRVESPDSGGGWIFKRSGQIRVEIRLPLDSRLRALSGSADIRVDGRVGTAELSTGSGDTFVATTSGDLVVKTGSGDIRCDHVGGEFKANSGSGDVSISVVAGPIAVVTASGDVLVDDARVGGSAHTASGDIRLRAVRAGEVRANSASGDISVGVPAGTRVWMDLNTVSGSTVSHLEMSSTPPEGGAQVNLRLQTVSGDITINRAAAIADPPADPSTVD